MKPIACTLGTTDLTTRRARWDALAGRSLQGIDATATGLVLRFAAADDELDALAELERGCCTFATWTVAGGTLAIDGDSPDSIAAIHGMFLRYR